MAKVAIRHQINTNLLHKWIHQSPSVSKLIELAGSRGSQLQDGLNARVHTLHDAARWKHYFIGQFALNGTRPPRRGTL